MTISGMHSRRVRRIHCPDSLIICIECMHAEVDQHAGYSMLLDAHT